MTPADLDALVNDYLHRLDSALRPLPGNRRQQLLADVTEHLTEARAQLPNQSEAAIRELLDRVGQPEDIAEAAMTDGPSRKRHFDRRLLVGVIGLAIAAAIAIPLVMTGSGSQPPPKPSSTATAVVPGQGPSSPAAVSEAINAPRPNAIADWTGESVRLTHSGSYSWNTATKVVTAVPSSMISGGFAVEGGHAIISGFHALPVTLAPKTTPAPGAAIHAPTYWQVTFSVSQLKGSPRLVLLDTYMNR
jgi:hypothetical protein